MPEIAARFPGGFAGLRALGELTVAGLAAAQSVDGLGDEVVG